MSALRKLKADGTSPFVFAAGHGGYALANEGTDTWLTQDFLGHASIANTVRYTQLAPGRQASVRVRVRVRVR